MSHRILLITLIAALAATLTACGDDEAQEVTTTSTTTSTTVAGLVCPDPVAVASHEDLVAALAASAWSQGLEGTADLSIAGTLTLDSAEVPLPATCLAENDCRHEATFYVSGAVAGVTIEGPASGDYDMFTDSLRLVLTNTSVRITASLLDTHPGPFNFVPMLTVHPACGTPCTAGLRMCPADGLCYDFTGYYAGWCRGCEGRSPRECACRDGGGPLPDGTSCQFAASGDVICDGTCQEGVCVSDYGAGC